MMTTMTSMRRSRTQPIVDRGVGAARRALTEAAESANIEDITIEQLAQARRRARAAPDDPRVHEALIGCHLRLAYLRHAADDGVLGPKVRADLRNAAEAWDRLLALEPADPDPDVAFQMERAFREGWLDDPARRRRALEIGLEHTDTPTSGRYEHLARLYAAEGRIEEARTAAERAVELMPRLGRRWMRHQMKDLEVL